MQDVNTLQGVMQGSAGVGPSTDGRRPSVRRTATHPGQAELEPDLADHDLFGTRAPDRSLDPMATAHSTLGLSSSDA